MEVDIVFRCKKRYGLDVIKYLIFYELFSNVPPCLCYDGADGHFPALSYGSFYYSRLNTASTQRWLSSTNNGKNEPRKWRLEAFISVELSARNLLAMKSWNILRLSSTFLSYAFSRPRNSQRTGEASPLNFISRSGCSFLGCQLPCSALLFRKRGPRKKLTRLDEKEVVTNATRIRNVGFPG